MLLACRFLLSAVIMFILFRKRIKAHFNREYLIRVLIGTWSLVRLRRARAPRLVSRTPAKNAFLTGTYCVLRTSSRSSCSRST